MSDNAGLVKPVGKDLIKQISGGGGGEGEMKTPLYISQLSVLAAQRLAKPHIDISQLSVLVAYRRD